MAESQNIEYKQSWRDEHLKSVCGFANAQGGKIFIGIDDLGNVTGIEGFKKLMDDIPNKIANHLGLVVNVNLHENAGKRYIEIQVPVSSVPIAYHGIYHYRSGSTKQELKGISLQNLLLKKIGKRWEDIPCEGATINDLNLDTVKRFITLAINKNRIPADAATEDIKSLLTKLNLITTDGQLTNAAMLLFGKYVSRVTATATFRIGRFGKKLSDLITEDTIDTNLFDMPDHVMEVLKGKYLIRPFHYQGLERMEPLEYPEPALREAILNSIVHKEYASTFIFLKVYEDKLSIWNPGVLPEELTIEKLKQNHSSYPRNKNIATIFFLAGYIERWGRGTNNIIENTLEAGLPEPIYKEDQGGISITFLKDIYTEEYIKKYDINERQTKAILYVKVNGRITNKEYQQNYNTSDRTATRDLESLVSLSLLKKSGKNKGTFYMLG